MFSTIGYIQSLHTNCSQICIIKKMTNFWKLNVIKFIAQWMKNKK